jgi:AAA domain
MTHPLFRKEIFVETAFAKRLQKMLNASWDNRSWHLLVADPGAGKTMTIRDLQKRAGGRSVLAVVAPKNNDNEQALGDQLLAALGLPIRGHWSTRKPKLMGHLHQYGTEFLIVDDAHDLSLEHLMLLKEVTDQGKLQYDHPLGLCLVAAGEVRTILATLEQVYQPLFPQLNMRQWTSSIYGWLTNPVLDPTHSGRVTMDNLMKLVTTALERSYLAGETEVKAERFKSAAELLVLRHDTLKLIDGAGPEALPQDQNQVEEPGVNGKEPEEQRTVSENVAPNTPSTVETVETAKEQEDTGKTANCTFSGVVRIDLQRFTSSGINLVECPGCGRMRSLSPVKGILRFKAHTPRKQQTPLTEKRWSTTGTKDWGVVGG